MSGFNWSNFLWCIMIQEYLQIDLKLEKDELYQKGKIIIEDIINDLVKFKGKEIINKQPNYELLYIASDSFHRKKYEFKEKDIKNLSNASEIRENYLKKLTNTDK